jgi:hypothetical protein
MSGSFFDNNTNNSGINGTGKDLFLDPKVRQYGSHMVMTNVHKPTKKKYVNIDTRFSDEYAYSRCGSANFNCIDNYVFTLPERITEVKSMKILGAEIPVSYFNVSPHFENNYMKIVNNATQAVSMIVIDASNYTIADLQTEINNKLTAAALPAIIYSDVSGSFSKFSVSGMTDYTLYFDTDICGNFNKYNFRSKLGWLLGLREQSYVLSSASPVYSESFIDLSGPRYLYIVIDEYNNSVQNSVISPIQTSVINKKILGRLSIDTSIYPFGKIARCYEHLGSLVSDTRTYSGGKIDIHRLNVQLCNEYGLPVVLNGLDFSFVLEIETE